MNRKRAGRHDKSFFRNTAVKTKKINVNPVMFRGGIRM